MQRSSLQRHGVQSRPSRTGSFKPQSVIRRQGVHTSASKSRKPTSLRTQSDFGASVASTTVVPQPDDAASDRTLFSRDQMSAIMFDAAVNAFVTGAFESPMDLFCTVEELGLIPSTKECNTLLTALRKSHHHRTMQQFMGYMEQRKIKPNAVTYVLMITASAALSDLKQAEDYFDRLQSSRNMKLTIHAYRAVICACIDCNDFEKARAYFDEMVDDGIQLNPAILVTVFQRLTYLRSHIAEAADMCAAMLREMDEQKTRPKEEICKAAVEIYSKANYDKKVSALYERMKNRGMKLDSSTYCSVLLGLSNKPEHLELRNRVLRDMEKDDIRPNLRNYHRHFMSQAQSADDRQSLRLLDEMESAEFQPSLHTYNLALRRYSQEYSKAEVVEVWRRIQEIRDRMKARGVAPDVVTYKHLLAMCVLNKDPRKGIGLFEEMKAQGVPPDSDVFCRMITLSAELRAGDKEIPAGYDVDALLAEMEKEGCALNALVCVAALKYISAEEDGQERFKAFVTKINEAGVQYDKSLFETATRFLVASGDKAMVREVLSEALKQQKISKTIIYTITMREFIHHRAFISAVEILREMVAAGVGFSSSTHKVLNTLQKCDLSDDTRAEVDAILRPDPPVQL